MFSNRYWQLKVHPFLRDRDAQTLTEYAMIILFVIMLVIAGLSLLGQNLLALYQAVVAQFD